MTMPPQALEGLLVVDKPPGWTSHDVVARVRRLTGVRRVGHAGTLDPLATGVLLLGIGRATRVLEYLQSADKAYRATVRLGVETDSYDADGAVVASGDWSFLTEAEVRRELLAFAGTIRQRPPVFSAIKSGGRPLHRLARAGVPVTAPERAVTVYAIGEVEVELAEVRFTLHCSTGTYVRSIAHDLGRRLGCGAHLTALRRTATAGFSLTDAVTLERFEGAIARGEGGALLLPVDAAVRSLPPVVLGPEEARRLRHGLAPSDLAVDPAVRRVRACDGEGRLIAILDRREGEGRWRAAKVLQEQ